MSIAKEVMPVLDRNNQRGLAHPSAVAATRRGWCRPCRLARTTHHKGVARRSGVRSHLLLTDLANRCGVTGDHGEVIRWLPTGVRLPVNATLDG